MARELPAWLPPLMMLKEGTGKICIAHTHTSAPTLPACLLVIMKETVLFISFMSSNPHKF